MALEIVLVPVLADNYMYLLHDPSANETACVDPADADVMLAAAEKRGWSISKILITHKHDDHTAGVAALKEKTGATVYGPADEQTPATDVKLKSGDRVSVGEREATVIATPGHTMGHIVYHFEKDDALLSGDALFVLGCGRLFEGTPKDAWTYMQYLRSLPPETRVFCGHEYTRTNLDFAATVDQHNPGLAIYEDDLEDLLAAGKPSVPSTIAFETMMNPFMKADDPFFTAKLGMESALPEDVYGVLRERRNKF